MGLARTPHRRRMNTIAAVTVLVALSGGDPEAANAPCSGKKGGVAECRGETFICNDGSVSASKKSCSAYFGGRTGLLGGGAPDMSPTSNGDCSCRGGAFCVGPRGGQFCITDNGSKSYLRR